MYLVPGIYTTVINEKKSNSHRSQMYIVHHPTMNIIRSLIFNFRIFGHFEKPLFLNLVKHMESKILKCGEYLFRIGDLDDSIYVVQEGHINVKICESVSMLFQ